MTLNVNDRAAIKNSNRSAVEESLGNLAGFHTFPVGNPYKNYDVVGKDVYSPAECGSIVELMALGLPNHCLDGWSYLARSLSALLSGDNHASQHFAYYAELRAAMSLLNAAGVGTFNKQNFAINADGSLQRLGSHGTHVAVWNMFFAWVESAESAKLIASSLHIAGVPLGECISSLMPEVATPFALSDLLISWGLDLKQATGDKHSREMASYIPQVAYPIGISANEAWDFVETFWGAFEPNGVDRFDKIDRHILRSAISYHQRDGRVITEESYEGLAESVSRIAKFPFLAHVAEPEQHPLLAMAFDNTEPAGPFAMISRAALLLRTATSVARQATLKAGMMSNEVIEPWLGQMGFDRAILPSASLPEHPFDLWADVEEQMDRLAELRAVSGVRQLSRFELAANNGAIIPRLSEIERVAIWGLAPS